MLRSFLFPRTVHTSALLGLLIAACGGDTSSNTEPTASASETSSATPPVAPSSQQPTATVPGPGSTPPPAPSGATGGTGATGATGDTGASGNTGATGATGDTGDTSGPSGDTGETSAPIDTSAGPAASSGPRGDSSAPAPDDTNPAPAGDPNPSGLMEPGDGGIARPAGTAGNLTVLPWAGYSGAITYSFDDADPTQVAHKADFFAMEVPFTWYLTTKFGEYGNPMYKEALALGHEIGNHTSNHGGQGRQEVETFQSWLLEEFQVVAYTMAAPEGKTGDYTAVSQELFLLDRGAGNDGLIKPDDNPNMHALNNYIPSTNVGVTNQMNPKVDAAVSQGGWQTVCIHGFTGCNGCYQPIDWNGFKEHIDYAKSKDIWIGTMEDVAAYFIGRKLVKAAQPQTQGENQVYTWTLPNPFPPGKYVRVKVDGGTLSQDGVALPWNEHGFYEVALDTGELTLAP